LHTLFPSSTSCKSEKKSDALGVLKTPTPLLLFEVSYQVSPVFGFLYIDAYFLKVDGEILRNLAACAEDFVFSIAYFISDSLKFICGLQLGLNDFL
jgi:hypothetical protein